MPRESESRSFRYTQRSAKDIRERANKRSGDFDSIFKREFKVFKVKEGKNMIRILPPTWADAKHYGYDIWVNYSIGIDNQAYLSLGKMRDEPDPIAEAKKQAERDGDKKLAKALAPRERVLMWVLDRNAEEEGPQLWPAPVTLDKDLAKVTYDEDTKELIFIDEPNEGTDVRFYREGTGLNTTYDPLKIKLMAPSPIHEDSTIQKEWLDYIKAHPLPECLQFYDYDHINNVFGGQVAVRDEDEDTTKPRATSHDEEKQPPSRTNGRASRTVVEDENEGPVSRGRIRAPTEREGSEPAPRQSIRDRLAARRTSTTEAPFDED